MRPKTIHSEGRRDARSVEYNVWLHTRGYARKHKIEWAKEWESFPVFLKAVGRRPDESYVFSRLDREEGYLPGNAGWRPVDEVRCIPPPPARSKARMHTFNGETLPASEWAKRVGLPPRQFRRRLERGWTLEEAVTTKRSGVTHAIKKTHPTFTLGESLVRVSCALFSFPESQYVSSFDALGGGVVVVLRQRPEFAKGTTHQQTITFDAPTLGAAEPDDPNTIRNVLMHISSKLASASRTLLFVKRSDHLGTQYASSDETL
jgi:hypothetical protein